MVFYYDTSVIHNSGNINEKKKKKNSQSLFKVLFQFSHDEWLILHFYFYFF